MKATVVWSRTAQDRLAEIWLGSMQPGAVTAAANRIDSALANEPLRNAVSRPDGMWELEVNPLVVVFAWSDSDCRVNVEDVMELGPLDP